MNLAMGWFINRSEVFENRACVNLLIPFAAWNQTVETGGSADQRTWAPTTPLHILFLNQNRHPRPPQRAPRVGIPPSHA